MSDELLKQALDALQDGTPRFDRQRASGAISAHLSHPQAEPVSDDIEAIIACLGDDAELLRSTTDDCEEIAQNMDDAAQALERLAAPQAQPAPAVREPQWQPIETAPKSKDEILLVSVDGTIRIDSGNFAHHLMNAAKVDGEECHLTHWMPLPAAPGSTHD